MENVYRNCLDLRWLVTIEGSWTIWVEMTRDELVMVDDDVTCKYSHLAD